MSTARLLLLATLALAGCAETTDPDLDRYTSADGQLEAAFVETGVELLNKGSDTLYYAVFAEGALALFSPCLRPDTCPHLEPGDTVLVPFSQITAWSSTGSAAEVHHWTLQATGDGYEATDRDSFIVRRN